MAKNKLQKAENEHFTEMTWQSFPMWQCKHCPFDTLGGLAAMVEHLYKRHNIQIIAPTESAEMQESE